MVKLKKIKNQKFSSFQGQFDLEYQKQYFPPRLGGGDIINPECLFKLTFNLRYNNHNKQVYYINNSIF